MKSMNPLPFLLCLLALLPGMADAGAGVAPGADPVTVRELMRLDTELALELARRRRAQAAEKLLPEASPVIGSGATSAGLQGLELVGIYGVGQRLFAEVRSGGRRMLFLRGHPTPVGHEKGADTYRLKALAGRCVRLERYGQESLLCLSGVGGE